MSRHYILYDGRARYDVDEASVLEVLGDYNTLAAAKKNVGMNWKGVDCVLVSYKCEDGTLLDERVEP